jgi:hypothetical protein
VLEARLKWRTYINQERSGVPLGREMKLWRGPPVNWRAIVDGAFGTAWRRVLEILQKRRFVPR